MNVYIFGFDQTYAGLIVNMMDIFDIAKNLLKRDGNQAEAGNIAVKLVSADGHPILCQNNVQLYPHCAADDIQDADIFIATSIFDVDATLPKYKFLVDRFRKQYQNGTALASICTGAFLLAETGLLNKRQATTHRSVSDLFKKRYPKVHFKKEKFVVNQENIYCSEGAGSSINLAYYLIEKYMGHTVATKTAKFFAYDCKREWQYTRTIFEKKARHNDLEILKIQRWINGHLHLPLSITDLSHIACMSPRTFERRFKKATGDTPTVYIQKMKVAQAKQRLETTNVSFDKISTDLGYMNCTSFRKIFIRWTSQLPSEYRKRRSLRS